MQFVRDRATMLSESLIALKETGTITNLNPGGVARSLIEIMNRELGYTNDILQTNRLLGFVSTSNGGYLDLIGEGLFDLPRRQETRAEVEIDDNIIKFYTIDSSPLANHLTNQEIPAGTRIKSSDATKEYTVTTTVPVDTNQDTAYVGAQAVSSGIEQNVGVNILTSHDLGSTTIAVTNTDTINTGSSQETDAAYRYRITNAVKVFARANRDSVRLAALSTPGVADVIIENAASGTGTFNLILLPSGNTVPGSAMKQAQSSVNFVKGAGILSSVRQPQYVPVEILIQLEYIQGTSESEKTSIRRQAVTAILNYLGTIGLGSELVYNEVVQRVMEVSNKILDMRVLCWVFRRKPQRLTNIRLGHLELFLPDPEVSEPIKVV